MLKNILNLDGAQQLSKNEQKTISGGITRAQLQCIESSGCYSTTGFCITNFQKPGCGLKNVCCPI
jgi:hypothetical protein